MSANSEAPKGPTPVVLDMDVGVDDALALCLAMRSPEVSVCGVTAVHGNVPLARTAANAEIVLEVLGAFDGTLVAMGAAHPLRGPGVNADEVHGRDGLGGATTLTDSNGRPLYAASTTLADRRSATECIHELIEAHPHRLTLIATGPLTNVALAIQSDPVHVKSLGSIVSMGGTFRREGNMSAVAEFNIFADPEAAQIVLDGGVPLTLVPLDVTETVVLDRDTVVRHATKRLGRFIRDITDAVIDFSSSFEGIEGMYVHDALAVAYVVQPRLFRTVSRRVQVETESALTRGQTVADLRERVRFGGRPNADIAVHVEATAFISLLVDRVLRAEA